MDRDGDPPRRRHRADPRGRPQRGRPSSIAPWPAGSPSPTCCRSPLPPGRHWIRYGIGLPHGDFLPPCSGRRRWSSWFTGFGRTTPIGSRRGVPRIILAVTVGVIARHVVGVVDGIAVSSGSPCPGRSACRSPRARVWHCGCSAPAPGPVPPDPDRWHERRGVHLGRRATSTVGFRSIGPQPTVSSRAPCARRRRHRRPARADPGRARSVSSSRRARCRRRRSRTLRRPCAA
jgi:hypothetical protein